MNKKVEKINSVIFYVLLFFFILILTFTIISFYFLDKNQIPFFLQIFVKYHVFFMFTIGILGIIFGSFTQFIVKKQERNLKIKKDILKKNLFKLLSSDYKKILDYLILNNGNCTQYELSKLDGLNKLKVSRILNDMEIKKIIIKKRIGKINKIFLNDEILEVFKPN